MLETSDYLSALVQGTNRPEEEVLVEALKTGLREMWRRQLVGRYLRGEITRDAAVAELGLDLIELAERQRQAMEEDVQWGRLAVAIPTS
jgi:hypothetical protein